MKSIYLIVFRRRVVKKSPHRYLINVIGVGIGGCEIYRDLKFLILFDGCVLWSDGMDDGLGHGGMKIEHIDTEAQRGEHSDHGGRSLGMQ